MILRAGCSKQFYKVCYSLFLYIKDAKAEIKGSLSSMLDNFKCYIILTYLKKICLYRRKFIVSAKYYNVGKLFSLISINLYYVLMKFIVLSTHINRFL